MYILFSAKKQLVKRSIVIEEPQLYKPEPEVSRFCINYM